MFIQWLTTARLTELLHQGSDVKIHGYEIIEQMDF